MACGPPDLCTRAFKNASVLLQIEDGARGSGFRVWLRVCSQDAEGKEVVNMAKAVWNGQLLAESEAIEQIEGNVYFPEETVKREFLRSSSTSSSCPWKGQARYYTVVVDGQENPDAAWYYPDPKPAARSVKHHIAFWRGVEVTQ